jgi:hypothetical protein
MDAQIDSHDTDLLDKTQVALILRRSTRFVMTAWRGGQLNGYKLGARTVRFARADVENYLASHRVESR